MRADLEKRKKAMSKGKKSAVEVEFVGMTPELQALASDEPSGGLPEAYMDHHKK